MANPKARPALTPPKIYGTSPKSHSMKKKIAVIEHNRDMNAGHTALHFSKSPLVSVLSGSVT